MPVCGNPECRKEIPEGKAYCNEECLRRSYQVKGEDRFKSQFDRGSGSMRRESNIQKVAKMLEEGMAEEEICNRLGLWFKPSTVDDYLKNAKFLLSLKQRAKTTRKAQEPVK